MECAMSDNSGKAYKLLHTGRGIVQNKWNMRITLQCTGNAVNVAQKLLCVKMKNYKIC